MDFFLSIYLSFFFSLLPTYFKGNPQLNEIHATRDIMKKKNTVNDLKVLINQVKFF